MNDDVIFTFSRGFSEKLTKILESTESISYLNLYNFLRTIDLNTWN